MSISLDRGHLKGFIAQKDIKAISPKLKKAHEALHKRAGKGAEFLGWLDLPSRIEEKFLNELTQLAQEVQLSSDCLITIGIGGSYLGIRSTIEGLRASRLPVYYAGHNMSV